MKKLLLLALLLSVASAATLPTVRKVDKKPIPVGDNAKYYILAADYNALLDHTAGSVNLASYLPANYVTDGSVDYAFYWGVALAALPANGGTLVVPTGTWKLGSNLTIGPRQWIAGQGPGTIVKPTGTAFLFTSVASGIRFYSGISDLAIDGSNSNDHLIKVTGTAVGEGPTFLTFERVFLTQPPANKACFYFSSVAPLNTFNHVLDDVHCYNGAGHGLWITSSGGTQGSLVYNVRNSSFEGLGGHGIWLQNSAEGGKPGSVTIDGCNLEGNTLSALQVDGVNNLRVATTYFEQVTTATPMVFSGATPSAGVVLESNTFGAGGSAYCVDFGGTYTTQGVKSHGNQCGGITTAMYRVTNLAHSALGPDIVLAGKPMIDWANSTAWSDLDIIDTVNNARASTSDTTYFAPPKAFLAKADSTGASDSAAVIQGLMNYGASVTVDLPPGTFRVNAELWATAPNTRIRGAGRDLTTIVKGSATGTKVILDKGWPGLQISDLTIDANGQNDAVYFQGTGGKVERVKFKNIPAGTRGVLIDGSHVSVLDSLFQGDGSTINTGVGLLTGAHDVEIARSRFLGMGNGVYGSSAVGTGDIANVRVVDNYFDGRWWLWKTFGTNSGGTVTYGATTLVDSAHNPWSGPGGADTIRVLPVRTSGTSTAISNSTLTASGANFTGAGVAVGDLVRIGSSQGVVSAVNSATVLTVEEWISTADMSPLVPATGAFTVYRVITDRISSIAGATITTLNGWRYKESGAAVTPSAGTLYEIAYPHPNYQGIKFTPGTRNVSITGNVVRRSWSDCLTYDGTNGAITGNSVEEGQDTGITLGSGNPAPGYVTVSGNSVLRCGGNGIGISGSDNVVSGNTVVDNLWVGDPAAPGGAGGILLESQAYRNVVAGNLLKRNSATSTAPYLLTDASGGTGSNANILTGNRASGAATAEIALTSASQPWMRDNTGTVALYVSAKPGNFGTATLVAGTATVTIASVLAGDTISLARQATGGTAGHLSVGTITAGTSFVINSSSGTDTSTILWEIVR